MALLGIRHHFKGVFGAKSMGDTCKPDKDAFQGVLNSLGADPAETGVLSAVVIVVGIVVAVLLL